MWGVTRRPYFNPVLSALDDMRMYGSIGLTIADKSLKKLTLKAEIH
jgi:hypothetical protein